MRRRIIRKNKKRFDPRYFLHERLEEEGLALGEPKSTGEGLALGEPKSTGTPTADDPPPETTTLTPEQREGVARLHSVIKGILTKHSEAAREFDLALRARPDLQYLRQTEGTEEQGTSSLAATAPLVAGE